MAFSIIGFFKKIGLLRGGSGSTWQDDDYFTSSIVGAEDAPDADESEDAPDDSGGDDGGFDGDGGFDDDGDW